MGRLLNSSWVAVAACWRLSLTTSGTAPLAARKSFMTTIAKIALSLLLVTSPAGACSRGEPEMPPEDRSERTAMMGERSAGGMGGGMMEEMMGSNDGSMADMRTIRGLLANHESIDRQVEDVPGGVRTVTVSNDPEVTALIRSHVRDMRERYGRGQPIRMMDPVFSELFRHRDQARMEIEDITGGVRVLHVSDHPAITSLIRQHAHRFVSEAAEQGMHRAMQPTALPQGYDEENSAEGAGR